MVEKMFYIVVNNRFADTGFAYGEKYGKVNRGEASKCEKCGNYLTMLEWLPPFNVKLSKGSLGDVIYGSFNHFIVSENFKEAYENNGLTGVLSFIPVSLFQKGKQLSQKYYYPKITLSDTKVDLEKSKVIFEGGEGCSACQLGNRDLKKINGLYFVDENKILLDVFSTKILPGDLVFSKRCKEIMEGLSNLHFVNAKKYIPSWILP